MHMFINTRRGFTQNGYPKGFTLIELLVAVLIIGILAAVAMPQYQLMVDRTHAAKLLPILTQARLAQKRYYLEHGSYATAWDQLDVDFTALSKNYTSGGYQFFGPHNSKFILSTNEIQIHPDTTIAYYIAYYYKALDGLKMCRVTNVADKKAIQLCKKLTGRDTHTSGSVESGVLQYTFPESGW